jgi:hypothetical protein
MKSTLGKWELLNNNNNHVTFFKSIILTFWSGLHNILTVVINIGWGFFSNGKKKTWVNNGNILTIDLHAINVQYLHIISLSFLSNGENPFPSFH